LPKVAVKVDGIMLLTLLAVGAGVYVYSQRQAIADKVNPASDENIIYDDVIGGAGRAITGDEHWNLGGALYDWWH